ncbi:hypothetical protein BAE44_0005495 [Dichanthelium oligosanthes]|uniref:F-box domain-containing protein n=1 Tax=Dichanthelium oligosanthes TaxID=888268 RepID=A0A1E5W7U5_9POAL|nr:hypothetical protein BAE44_0005495 [Dichanthelium oligosanthes]
MSPAPPASPSTTSLAAHGVPATSAAAASSSSGTDLKPLARISSFLSLCLKDFIALASFFYASPKPRIPISCASPATAQLAMDPPAGEVLGLLALNDDLLSAILILLTLADLGRACESCRAIHRMITSPSFLRRLHQLHPPSLLGLRTFFGSFQLGELPSPAARAVARAADFRFSFLPDPGLWAVRDARAPAPALRLTDDLLADILIRLPALADLGRASAACPTFRRVIASHSFLRRFRALHPRPLLGTVSGRCGPDFLPAQPPHPSAAAARAVAEAADFSCSFLPFPDRWRCRDIRDGRALLSRIPERVAIIPGFYSRRDMPTPRRLQSPADLADDALGDIFLCLDSPADLARASAACASFRRVIMDHGFLRRYHALHPPPLLGILASGFLPAQPPHPSAVAARAFAQADAADFSFSFLPSPHRWRRRDSRDGRFLLSGVPMGRGYRRGDLLWITDLAVCDPVHRRYLLLPAIPVDLAAAVHQPDIVDFEPFLAPAAEDDKDTSFRVICLAQCATKLVLFVFSSGVGRWHAVTFDGWSAMITGNGNPVPTGIGNPASGSELSQRYYAHRCFYWLMHRRNKLLVLNTCGMEFSTAELPQDYTGGEIAIVEAGEGKVGMLSLCSLIPHGTVHLSYAILQNDGVVANQWLSEEVLPLPEKHRYDIVSVAGGYLLLQGIPEGVSLLHLPKNANIGCFSLEVKTLQLEWFCQTSHSILYAELYAGHPPSLSPPSI